MSFCPINRERHVNRTIAKASPVAVRRSRGVDLFNNYRQNELDALLKAGPLGSPSATLVVREIQEQRGGVLPRNWVVLKNFKANVDQMSQMKLCGGSSTGDNHAQD